MNLSSCSSIPPTICSSFSRKNGHPGCSSGCRLIGVYGMVGITVTSHLVNQMSLHSMWRVDMSGKWWCPSTPWLHSCGPTWVDRSTVNYAHCQLWTNAQGMTVGLLLNCRSKQRDDIWAAPSLYRSGRSIIPNHVFKMFRNSLACVHGTRPRCSPTSCYLAKKIHLLEDLQPEQHGFRKGKRIEEHVLTAHSQLWKYLAPFVNYSLRSFENIGQGGFGSLAIWRKVFHDMYMYFVCTMRTAYTVTLQKNPRTFCLTAVNLVSEKVCKKDARSVQG